MEQLPAFLEIWQDTLNWQPDDLQQQKFQQLYDNILLGNRQLNLTRITNPQEFWEKHLWDSLSGLLKLSLNSLNLKTSIIDIGTGAGFPGIPAAIAYPTQTFTLLDSTQKKISFVRHLLHNLSLDNAKALVGRAEKIRQEKHHQETYDIVLIRAVSKASVCAKYALPLLKIGGIAILYRGHWSQEESQNLQYVVNQLGGKIEKIDAFTTPITHSIRHCVYLYKQGVRG